MKESWEQTRINYYAFRIDKLLIDLERVDDRYVLNVLYDIRLLRDEARRLASGETKLPSHLLESVYTGEIEKGADCDGCAV
ncbi:hypothetical protein NVP1262O_41 [Vibrio phage 1.262.O._10N.286.51.A9]|nr:hypothetical protein NVP1262O_41 [Vibrio phage 1.262.O._10N.286.51.A9]